MAKLIILLATAFAALLLVDASIHRATVLIEEDDLSGDSGQDCRRQFEQQQKLRNCQEFMRYKSRQSQRGMNPQREEEQERQRCCDQLQNMESQCRCESLEYAMEEMRRGAGQEMQRMQEIRRVAQQIPSMCQMSPGQCQFGQRSIVM